MSSVLERIRNNKNIRQTAEVVDDLLKPNAVEEVAVEVDNKNKNTDTSVNTNVNESVNIDEVESKIETTSKSKNKSSAIDAYISKNVKKKFEDTHEKDTYWIDKNIKQTLQNITNNQKGLKTKIINDALRDFFKKHNIQIKEEYE